ncbi:hypothetical protein D3C77_412270 [compost metagenome]
MSVSVADFTSCSLCLESFIRQNVTTWIQDNPSLKEGAPKQAEQLVTEFKNSVKGREKAVILMHDTYGKEETAKALPEIISYLKEQGYTFKIMK